MSAITRRTKVTVPGTPEYLTNIKDFLPEGVPLNALVVDVDFRIEDEATFGRMSEVTASWLVLTLEWPA